MSAESGPHIVWGCSFTHIAHNRNCSCQTRSLDDHGGGRAGRPFIRKPGVSEPQIAPDGCSISLLCVPDEQGGTLHRKPLTLVFQYVCEY